MRGSWKALAKHIADPGFGVTAGAALRVRQLGLLGYVACFSPTLRDALRRIAQYGRLVTEEIEFSKRVLPIVQALDRDHAPSVSHCHTVGLSLVVAPNTSAVARGVTVDVRAMSISSR